MAGAATVVEQLVDSLICIGGDWGRNPSTLQFIARELARERPVLWVNSLGLRPPRPTTGDLGRIVRKLRERREGIRAVDDGLHVFTPILLPVYAVPTLRRLNAALLTSNLRRAITRLGMKNPALVVANPAGALVVGRLGERCSAYYCADEWTDLPGMPRSVVRTLEADLCARTNLTVVTSEALRRRKATMARRVVLLRHGVEHAHFATALAPATSVPEDLARLPRPRLGFHGLVQDIVDFDLVTEMARLRPSWSIVFIGPRTFDARSVPGFPNVHFLGRRDYADMPRYLKGLDVGLIPFRLTERTLHANPVKLREYLAAGVPVVSVRMPEVEPYADRVRFAQGAGEFASAVESLLVEDDEAARRRRSASVAAESWSAVAGRLGEILED